MLNTKMYITYEEPFNGRTFTSDQMHEVYRDLANKTEYPDFTDWLTDMLKSGVFEVIENQIDDVKSQSLIENLLDKWLSQKELEYIKSEWHAFYADPMAYKNSVVVDMIKQALESEV